MSTSAERVCRLAQEAAEADDSLTALETLVRLRRELEVLTREQVAQALGADRSFGEVARALGISRQAAHRRYRGVVPAPQRRVAVGEQARQVLRLAQEEARATRAIALGSEHIVIAVLRCGGDEAQTLVEEGATLERVRACGRALTPETSWPSGFRSTEPGVREFLREATRQMVLRGECRLDVTGLLVAALTGPDGGARRVLTALGVDASALRVRLEPDERPRRPEPGVAVRTRRKDVG